MELREVPIRQIKESKYNPSIRTDRGNKAFISLKYNIKKHGLITPVSLGVGKKDMLLVAGHRRLNCLKDLGKRTILAIINPEINDSNYDEMFVAENVDSMELSAAQETERWLIGAPVISKDVLKSINLMLEIGGRKCIERIVSEEKSPNTYLIAINKYTSYTKQKKSDTSKHACRRAQRECLYWMFNVGTAYDIKVSIDTFIDANVLRDCIENRKKIEALWSPSDKLV
tara:strand:+ start:82 stop:765 length:684 start_codon:yes stop_codon:yes gene_type:complete